jgi:hypothetical protein
MQNKWLDVFGTWTIGIGSAVSSAEVDAVLSDLREMVNARPDDALAELKEELRITDDLLTARMRVMDAIPECPAHGGNCVPHALEWIEKEKATLNYAAPEQVIVGGQTCKWTPRTATEDWIVGCSGARGLQHLFGGTLADNGYNFCPSCGKPIEIVETEPEKENEDT